MKITKLFEHFFNNEKASGFILIFCTVLSLIITNSSIGNNYHQFWQTQYYGHSLEHWINDGLMAVFFLLIGLELEREIYVGELSKIQDALFPIFGAIGGMFIPAGIFLLFNYGTPFQSGAGIPMATDIAFALAILSLLGKKVPFPLKVFLTALAVIDDLGAIIIIAIFYTKTLLWINLFISLGIFALLLILNRLKVKSLFVYLIGGVLMWYFMLHSGVHATISGVLLAFAIPFEKGGKKSASYILQHFLHKPVAFIILPLFALANTSIFFNGNILHLLSNSNNLGIFLGLVLGKPLGVFAFTFLCVKLGFCVISKDINWKLIFGVGLLAGTGFTMSIFITLLAFDNQNIINNSKLIIVLSSVIAGLLGFVTLKILLKQNNTPQASKNLKIKK